MRPHAADPPFLPNADQGRTPSNSMGAGTVQQIPTVPSGIPTLAETWGTLFSSAPVAAWIIDTNGIMISMEGRAIAEASPSLLGRSIFEVYADLPHVMEQARRVLRGESVEFRAEAHGRVWQAFYRPLLDANGKVTHGYGLAIDITEKVSASEARDQLSERLNFLHQHSGENLWEWDLASGIMTSSRPINNPTNAAESKADEWIASIHPDDTERVMSALRGHFDRREPYCTEYRIRMRSGEYRWVTSRGQAEWSADGRPIRMVGIMSDIDGSRRLRQQRDEIAKRHDLLVKSAPIGIILWGSDARVREWNPAAERIFGFSQAEAIGMPAHNIVPPALRPRIDELFRSLRAKTGGERSRNENLTKAGHLILCEWYNTTLYDEHNEVVGIASLVEDVTEQARSQTLLAERERDLRMIASSLPALVAYVDSGLRYRFANQAYQRWFGHSPEKMVGRTIEEVMGREHARRIEPQIRKALAGESVRYELEIKTIAGAMQMDVVYVPRQGPTGIEGLYVLASDITERKRIERELSLYKDHLESLVEERTAQLAESADRLQRAERLAGLGTLAAGLGHDINNLLLPMRCIIDAMAAGGVAPPGGALTPPPAELAATHASNLSALRLSLDFLGNLSKSLLILALSPDDMALGHDHTNPNEWWSTASPVIRPVVPAGASLDVYVQPDLPMLAIAPAQLTRCVLNLVLNGIEAAGTSARIQISFTLGSDRRVSVAVEDNGPGMPEAVRRQAMDPFFTTKRRSLSTGLGLALVNAVVSAAGGSVQIDQSTPDGTRVVLLIPSVSRARESTSSERTRATQRQAFVSVRDPRICAFLLAYLNASGFVVSPSPPSETLSDGAVWIIDHDGKMITKARAFTSPERGRRVILIGEADPIWAGFPATVVTDPADTLAIATALRPSASVPPIRNEL